MSDQELKDLVAENSRAIKQLNKQMGELGNKFGSFTEGLALKSVYKLLSKQFGVEMASLRVRKKNKATDEWMELDYFGYENSNINRAVIVEVKSHFRHRDIEKVQKMVTQFKEFFPEHADKDLYMVVAYVDYEDADVLEQALEEGFYLASVHDEVFTLNIPKGFQGKNFK